MNLVIKIIILLIFFNTNVFAQNNDFFIEEVESKLKPGMAKAKVIIWSDKKIYKIGEKIKIVVEWNKGNIIDEDEVYLESNTNVELIRTSYNQSYVAGEKLYNRVYTLIANKTGKIKLSPFKIEYDFIEYESRKLRIRIKDN